MQSLPDIPRAGLRLAVVTNILPPYRIPFFEALAQRADDFLVLLCAERHANRDWAVGSLPFKTQVLPGFTVDRRGSVDPTHINWGVLSALRRFSPSAVMSGGYSPAHLQAFAYCRLWRRLYVPWGELVTTHSTQQNRLARVIRRLVIANSHAFVASSHATRSAFESYGAKRDSVLVSSMPVGTSAIRSQVNVQRNSGAVEALRSRYSAPRFFCASRLVDEKGLPQLLRAFRIVQFQIPSASLVVAGTGPARAEYARLVAHLGLRNIAFVGQLTSEPLAAHYGACDVFVFPTLHDTFGAVIPEAIAAGALVVSSVHAAAAPDFVVDCHSGFLADPLDVDQFAARMVTAANLSPEKRGAMIAQAQRALPLDDVASSADAIDEYLRRSLASATRVPQAPQNERA